MGAQDHREEQRDAGDTDQPGPESHGNQILPAFAYEVFLAMAGLVRPKVLGPKNKGPHLRALRVSGLVSLTLKNQITPVGFKSSLTPTRAIDVPLHTFWQTVWNQRDGWMVPVRQYP